ncbi:MAG: pilus assembly protein TadG-related protein [Alphaproteobacteria bacterium]|nr:pilus assembly protein TadG-related protein [Alphaproteobacteria bacterium]
MITHITAIILRLLRTSEDLRTDQRGAVIMMVGLGLFMLIGATGIAIDMSRLQTSRAKLASALDAAGLAAGSKINSRETILVVNNYLDANFPAGFMDTTITNVNVTVSRDKSILDLNVTANVRMKFMQIFGQEYVTIAASSQITRENKGLELVMVLDVTGSMYGSKIGDLRTAATDMVDILYGQKETVDNLWIGVVPYVTTVNVGSDKISWLRDYDESRYPRRYPNGATKWKGCVEARNQWPENNGLDTTDTLPYTGDKAAATAEQLTTAFPMYFWEDEVDNDWIDRRNRVTINEDAGYSNEGGLGPNVACGNEITPFTSNKATVQGAIDALTPWRRGGTMSSMGLAWGWRLMSPSWRGMWGHEDARLPLDYNTPLMSKAVIIMTDGVNEVYRQNSLGGPGGSDYMAYGRIEEEKLGNNINTRNEGVGVVNAKFATICNNMKAQGIVIYTVTFQLNNSSNANNARDLFRNCASHADYYFDSPDGATLRQSFKTIGDSLANLMISQ